MHGLWLGATVAMYNSVPKFYVIFSIIVFEYRARNASIVSRAYPYAVGMPRGCSRNGVAVGDAQLNQGPNRSSLDEAVRRYFASGLAEGTKRSYSSAQRRYETFCTSHRIPPLPLTENKSCLFVAFLAEEGLSPQSIASYLAALRHLQIAVGLGAPPTSQWPRLYYTLRGVKRSVQKSPQRVRLPITPAILRRLCAIWSSGQVEDPFMARLLWAACCLGFFGFLRAGEFTAGSPPTTPGITVADVAVDRHRSPTLLRVFLRRAKTDPFGNGVNIFLGRTGCTLCPVVAILNYLAVRPLGEGALLVLENGEPLTKDLFVRKVRKALTVAGIDHQQYAGHSFRIGAATTAAAVGIPAHTIKMMGRWTSEAYTLYIREPRESLAAVARRLVRQEEGSQDH